MDKLNSLKGYKDCQLAPVLEYYLKNNHKLSPFWMWNSFFCRCNLGFFVTIGLRNVTWLTHLKGNTNIVQFRIILEQNASCRLAPYNKPLVSPLTDQILMTLKQQVESKTETIKVYDYTNKETSRMK